MELKSPPYVAFGYDQLKAQPALRAGDHVWCSQCAQPHVVEDADPPGVLLFYRCGRETFLAGIGGKSVVDLSIVKPAS